MNAYKEILRRINEGVNEYEKDILNLSDKELYKHVYEDYEPEDFASKELKRRGIGKCECNGAKQIIGCPSKSCCYWETNGD